MRLAVIVIAALSVSCAQKEPQRILYNTPPRSQLAASLEVMTRGLTGFGAPVGGRLVLTADHITSGQPVAWWRWKVYKGRMTLVRRLAGRDLTLYMIDTDQENQNPVVGRLLYSDVLPKPGEEVYWSIHTREGERGMARGWVLGASKDKITVSGWFHPGTSGSPVLRADGTLVGIAVAGSNWSCADHWGIFLTMDVDKKIECLFRRSMFNAEMVVSPTIGGV